LNVQLPTVIKYLIVDGIRSVIGGHLCQFNAKFKQICRGREVPGTLPSTTTASGGCRNCDISGQALELNDWGLPVLEHKADLDRACARRVLVSLSTRVIFRLVFSV
jgi:hypothetical protein